jgi:hypothetical protein
MIIFVWYRQNYIEFVFKSFNEYITYFNSVIVVNLFKMVDNTINQLSNLAFSATITHILLLSYNIVNVDLFYSIFLIVANIVI